MNRSLPALHYQPFFNNNNNYLIHSRNIVIIVAVKKIHECEMKYAGYEEHEMKSHFVTDPLGENRRIPAMKWQKSVLKPNEIQ